MTVGVTYKMAKIIQGINSEYQVKLVKLNNDDYKHYVHYDGEYFAYDYGDVDNSGKLKAIKVVYPYDYYASPLYITTKDLLDAYKSSQRHGDSDKSAYDNFISEVKDLIEV